MPQAQGDSCLECHRDGLHIENEGPKSSIGQVQADWHCSDHDHHPMCEADETCCDVDDCHVDCGSVCDGFVDCDSSTACSVAHCDDTHCDEQNCESTEPVCFDHCCDSIAEQDFGFDFFGFNPQFSFDTSSMLPTATMRDPVDDTAKIASHLPSAHADPCYHQVFSTSYQAHANHCDQDVINHLGCHDFQKDLQGMMPSQQPSQSVVNTEDIFHLFGVCSDFSVCHDQLLAGPSVEDDHQERSKLNQSPTILDCFHSGHPHVEPDSKNPNDLNVHVNKGPHRNRHRCRAHPYSPYSRQSRSSVSSQFLSSPAETPPPLDRGASSALTSPEFSAEDSALYVCRWTTTTNGVKVRCGATFAEAGALQDHMVSSHMNTLDGAKGHGYYCCWEGCLRPDGPFSQRSKLQGHFLTHSNCESLPGFPVG